MKFLYILFLLLISVPVWAQDSASVIGYVTDARTGETLISANIAIEGSRTGTSTNTEGFYQVGNLAQGSYTLVVTYIGYQKYSQKITLEKGETRRLDIELKPEGYQLEEIVVESEAEEEENQQIGSANLETELIKKVPAVFQADVFRSIQLLPGIKAASDYSSGLYIRGGSPDQTLILLDGSTVYNPSHFFGFFSTFNPDAIKDIQLHKGGYPAKYGGRLGSVLTIFNKDGNRKEFQGSATVGMLTSRASVEGPFKNGSWMFAIRRSTLEPLLAGLRRIEDNIPESFYFLDLNGKVNYDVGPNDRLSLAIYGGTDDLSFPLADDAAINLNYGNQTLSTKWTHLFSDKLFSNFTLTGARYFNFPSFDIAATPFRSSNNIYDFSLKGDLEYFPNQSHEWSGGFWLGALTLKLNEEFDGSESFSSRTQSHYGSLYLQDQWSISDSWSLTPGLRLQGFSDGGYLRLEPRLSMEYKPSERLRFQAAYGRYNQFLTLLSNEAFSGFDTWLTADEGVPPAYGDHYVGGIKSIPWDDYALNLEVYYRTMEDLFEPDPFLPDRSGLPYQDTFRFGKGHAYGAELFFERQAGSVTGFVGYTLSVTRRKFPGFNESLPDGGTARFYPPKYDRLHDVNVVLNYNLSSRWSVTATFNYASGQAYTRPLGRTRTSNFPTTASQLNQLLVGKVNASRLPPYNRLDLSFSRYGSFFGIGEAEWQLQLINVYSRRNIWFYNYDFQEDPVERNAVPLLPMLPTVSYTLNF